MFGAALSVALTSCSVEEGNLEMDLSAVRQDLETLANARILVGHQSVGRDILTGLASLASETGVNVRIAAIDGVPPDDRPGIFHTTIGSNGNPNSKCEAFERLVSHPEAPPYDIGMMKFCYEDLRYNSVLDATGMLERYAQVVGNVRVQTPALKLIHITIPLVADPPGKKTLLQRFLRRPVGTDADNVARNEFNSALRHRFARDPIFDIAVLESTRPNGERSFFVRSGGVFYTLAPDWTDDGAHLNARAQRRAAAELARVVALALKSA